MRREAWGEGPAARQAAGRRALTRGHVWVGHTGVWGACWSGEGKLGGGAARRRRNAKQQQRCRVGGTMRVAGEEGGAGAQNIATATG